MKAKLLMIQGTTSGSGKSIITTAICRILSDEGYNVAPFKAQNMSSKLHTIPGTADVVAQAQAVQALASRKLPDTRINPILLKPVGDYKSDLIFGGPVKFNDKFERGLRKFCNAKWFSTCSEFFRKPKK